MKMRYAAAFSSLFVWGALTSAPAATYYWDNNGTNPGFGTAAGTWAAPTVGDATQGWSTSNTGVLLPGASITTVVADLLNFGTSTAGIATGSINVSGTVTAGNLTFGSSSGAITLSGGTIDMGSTAGLFTVNNASDTVNSVLTGTNGLTKAGSGNLILNGANTFTGTITVNAGTLTAIGDTVNVLSAGRALVLAGGTFNYSSSSVTINSLTVGNINANVGGTSTIRSEETGAGSSSLTTGSVVRAAGGILNFETNGASTAIVSTPGVALNRGIFYNGEYAFASAGGVVGAVVYGTTPNTSTVTTGNAVTTIANNYFSVTGAVTSNNINIQGGTIKLAANGTVLTNTGATSVAGFLTNGNSGTVTGGTVRQNGEMVFAANGASDVLTINSGVTIFNGGVTTLVTKTGAGTVVFSGNNTYNGNTYVNKGTLQSTTATGLGYGGGIAAINLGNSNTTVAAGATLDLAPASAMTVNEAIILNGGALTNSGSGTTTIDSGIAALNLTNLGTGGSATSGTVAFGGTGTGATATFALTAGVSSNVTLTNSGTGYTGTTPVTFTATGQTTSTTGTAILSSVALSGTANTIGGNGNLVIKAIVADASGSLGGFTKVGTGTLTLSGNNTYSGSTTVSSGALVLTGNLLSTSAVAVNGGNLKSGAGNISLGVGSLSMSSGSINPGDINTIGSFTLASGQNFSTTGGTLNFDIDDAATLDQILSTGSTFSLSGTTLALNLISFTTPDYSSTYTLLSGFTSGTISGLTITGYDTANYTASLSNLGVLSFAAVPEPSTYALLGMGLAGLWFLRRRKKTLV